LRALARGTPAPSNEEALPRRTGLGRRVLRVDPSQEYLLYVPSTRSPAPPLVVSVHGTSRNANAHARLFSAYSEMYGAVLVVPHFCVTQHPDYQRLGRTGLGKRADLALNEIVAEVAALTGASAQRFHLFGFSAGAQFAHRYLMAHPHRIKSAVIACAGWYTFPDATRRFPSGIRPTAKLPGVRFDAEEFLSVPMKVIVRANDNDSTALRRGERLDREQGSTRVERARNWVAAMQAATRAHHLEPAISYEELVDSDRSFRRLMLRGGLGDKVFEAMFGPPPSGSRDKLKSSP
jgi:poly(3-hydroxybutyrate) depolymerase